MDNSEQTIPSASAAAEAVQIISEMLRMPRTRTTFANVADWINTSGASNVRDGSAMSIIGRLSKVPSARREEVFKAVLEWIEAEASRGKETSATNAE